MAAGTTQQSQAKATKYRFDLDGLRGIAIAFVVVFHVFVGRVSGGVDVFLLLSGYFFLGSQLRYAIKPNASLNPWWPVWRTIRRLFPALLVTLMSTILAVHLWIPELRTTNLSDQLLACIGYFQNWELATQGAAYGAASSTTSPLQHLWSMAVQGQFYLMAIAFAWLLAIGVKLMRRRRKVVTTLRIAAGIPLILITLGSFGYAVYLHSVDQSLNYYSTWSRLWELTLGAVLVLYAEKLRIAKRLSVVFTYLGLLMVVSTGLLFDGATLFPGPAVLFPLGGAALVILGGGQGATWLSSRFMLWLGKIAYPLYLWHWPILIVSTAYLGEKRPSVALGLGVVVVSILVAQLTHVVIEEPFKQHAKRPVSLEGRSRIAVASLSTPSGAIRAVAALCVATLCWTAVWIPSVWQEEVDRVSGTQLNPVLYPGAAALKGVRVPNVPFEPDPFVLANTLSPAWTDGCISLLGDDPEIIANDNLGPDHCLYGDIHAKKVAYLVGGSHAEQWMAAWDEIGKQHGIKIVPFVRQGCPMYKEEKDDVFSEECTTFNQKVIERITEDRPDLVISNSTRPLLEKGHTRDEVPQSYPTFWEFLKKEKIPFIGLRDNPWFVLAEGEGWMVSQCVENGGSIEECGLPRSHVYADTDPSQKFFTEDSMLSVDTADWFCPDDFCPAVIGNIYIYRDGNHISDAYALSLVPLLWAQISTFVSKI